jgi:DegV family protein with EDD domain
VSKVGIVTDSTCCIPEEFVKEHDIRIVPVGMVIDRKPYRDTDLTNEEFWRLFYSAREPVTTSAVNVGDIEQTFTDLGKQTDGIVCILVSKVLSVTYQSAEQAKEMVQSENPNLKIEIIDSKASTGAMGFIVMEAARAAQAGKSFDKVVKVAREMVPKVKYFIGLDTLKYLIRIGRAPKMAVIGDMFGIKPIVGMVNNTGLVENLGRARGKQKCMQQMVDMIKDYIDESKPINVMVHYTDSIEAGQELKDMVTSRYNCKEVYFTPYTPVMAAATGPLVAVAFYQE